MDVLRTMDDPRSIRFTKMNHMWGVKHKGNATRLVCQAILTRLPVFIGSTKRIELHIPRDVLEWIHAVEDRFVEKHNMAIVPTDERIEVKWNQHTRAFRDDVPIAVSELTVGDHVVVDLEWVGMSTRYTPCRSLFTLKAIVIKDADD